MGDRKRARSMSDSEPMAVEMSFARVLAHNDVKIRNKGINKLKVTAPPCPCGRATRSGDTFTITFNHI